MKMKNLIPVLAIMSVASMVYLEAGETEDVDRIDLSENLVLRLVIAEDGATVVDLELLVGHRDSEFSVEHLIQKENEEAQPLRFRGTLENIGYDVFHLTYTLSKRIAVGGGSTGPRQQVSYSDIGWQSTARLSLGEEVVLMREPTKEHRLTIFRETARSQNKPQPENGVEDSDQSESP